MTHTQSSSVQVRVTPGASLSGTCRVPGDKSISHRALILGALAEGESTVRGLLDAGDTRATRRVVQALGVELEQANGALTVHGRGLRGLQPPVAPLDCGHAGTAIRLMAGVLSGQPFDSILDGSSQLRRRPMRRVVDPLRQMGAQIVDTDGRAPLRITGAPLRGIAYSMPVASAQVKSAVLLAGLLASGPTAVIEPGPARDHTERMLRAMGVDVETAEGCCVTLIPPERLRPLDLRVPGDFSSAAFVLIAALLAGSAEVTIEGVGVNPTRTGLLDILRAMGADIRVINERDEAGEPVADLVARRADLRGTVIEGEWIVRAIDEFPALMIAALRAEGVTEVRGASELRVKETDRIAVMAAELRKLGAVIHEQPDGFIITGPQCLSGAVVDGHDDHRVAMALVLAGLVADGPTIVTDARCIEDSFPGFVETLQSLGADVVEVAGE